MNSFRGISFAVLGIALMLAATNAAAQSQTCTINYDPVPAAVVAGSPVTIRFTGTGCASVFDYDIRDANNQIVPLQTGDDPRTGRPTANGTVRFTPPQAGTFVVVIKTIPAGCLNCTPTEYRSPAINAVTALGNFTLTPDVGSPFGGDSVVIMGQGFSSACTVTFGGRTAPIQGTPTASMITVTTPSAADPAQTGPVSVIVSCGTAGTQSRANAFRYRSASATVSAISPSSGPVTGVTPVTITGDEFTTLCTRVTFDGVAATNFLFVNRTTITASTPTSPLLLQKRANVVVDCGSSGMPTTTFTYTAAAPPSASVAVVIPPNGGQVTITGNNLSSVCNVFFGSMQVASNNVTTTGSGLLVTAPPNPAEGSNSTNPRVADSRVPLVVQCGTTAAETAIGVVTYAAAGFTVTPSNPIVGQTVTFNSQPSTGNPMTFSWNFGDNTPSSSLPNPTHVYTTDGTYTVTLTATYGVGITSTTARRITVIGTAEARDAFTPRLVVPAATRVLGAGNSFFKTQLWLTNRTGQPMTLGLAFVPSGATGNLTDFATVSVPAFSTVAYSDVVLQLFGRDAVAGNIFVETATATSSLPFVSARTYTDAGFTGTFGQFIPSFLVDAAATYLNSAFIGGLELNQEQRTNIGVVNLTDVEFSVMIQALDQMGNPIGSTVATVLPRSFNQLNNPVGLVPANFTNPFSVTVSSTFPGARFFAYASKIDNSSNDPIFIPSTLVARTEQWIHPLADVQGGNARFGTSLLFAQPNASAAPALPQNPPAQATLELFNAPQILPIGVADLSNVFSVAGASRFYKDAFSQLLTNATRGVLYTLHLLSPRPIVMWARFFSVKNIDPAQSFGQLAPAFGREDLIGSSGALLQGLTNDARFYFNYAVINVDNSSATVTVTVHDGNNGAERASLTETITLNPLAATGIKGGVQFASGLTDGYIIVRPAAGSEGKVYSWATRNDRTSTDSIYIRPQPIPTPPPTTSQ